MSSLNELATSARGNFPKASPCETGNELGTNIDDMLTNLLLHHFERKLVVKVF